MTARMTKYIIHCRINFTVARCRDSGRGVGKGWGFQWGVRVRAEAEGSARPKGGSSVGVREGGRRSGNAMGMWVSPGGGEEGYWRREEGTGMGRKAKGSGAAGDTM